MKILELYYPKKLSEVVSRLRPNQSLNESALDLLHSHIKVSLVAICLLTLIFFFYEGLLLALVVGLISMLGLKIEMAHRFKNLHGVYIFGNRKEAEIIDRESRLPKRIALSCFNNNGETLKLAPLHELWDTQDIYKKGDNIHLYVDPEGYYSPMPDISEIKMKYCLDSSKL